MTEAQRLAILGPDTMAEIRRRVAAAPPPSAELLAELRPVLAPALQRTRLRQSAQQPLAA
jgi:hypothetical protein